MLSDPLNGWITRRAPNTGMLRGPPHEYGVMIRVRLPCPARNRNASFTCVCTPVVPVGRVIVAIATLGDSELHARGVVTRPLYLHASRAFRVVERMRES